MKIALGQDSISNIDALTDDEIVFIMERINAFSAIDDLSDFFAAYPERAVNIRNILMTKRGGLPSWYVLSFSKTVEKKPELMGLFGFSWQEKIVNYMKGRMKGNTLAKVLSSWWSENTKLIDNLHREYLIQLSAGSAPVTFIDDKPSVETDILSSNISQKLGIDKTITDEFLRSLYMLARDGKIDYNKLDPKAVAAGAIAAKTLSPKNTFERIAISGKTLLFLGGLATIAYIYNSFKGKM